jgi:hypothetical protein
MQYATHWSNGNGRVLTAELSVTFNQALFYTLSVMFLQSELSAV